MRIRNLVSFAAACLVATALPVLPVAAQGMDGVDWMQKAQKDTAGARAPNTLSPAEVKTGWIAALRRQSTPTGWHGFGRDTVVGWDIVNGELIALGQGGDHANDIVTDGEFENFELLVDWKLSPQGQQRHLLPRGREGVRPHLRRRARVPADRRRRMAGQARGLAELGGQLRDAPALEEGARSRSASGTRRGSS